MAASRKVGFSLPKDGKQASRHGLPAWSGQRQRANLKGFARLKAILWRRSLWLYQSWRLAGCPWYPPLSRALRQASRGMDLFTAERVRREADVFGETPPITVLHLLERVQLVLERPELLVDLGCGRGVTCLTAASLGIQALGFEQEESWVRLATEVAGGLGLPASFRQGDFLQAEWPARALYLIVATAFPEEMRSAIAERLKTLGCGAVALTADWSLPGEDFEELWHGRLPVEWGTARFSLWRLRRAGAGPLPPE
jgi:hypothetical protein